MSGGVRDERVEAFVTNPQATARSAGDDRR